jgi:hypothetical protein
MKHYVGLDVSIKQTAICIVDEAGNIVREAKVATELTAIVAVLNTAGVECARVGLEAGPMSQMAGERLARGGATGGVRGDTPHEGGAQGPASEQERPQRCPAGSRR